MRFSDNDGTGHPRRFGMAQCRQGHWRPVAMLNAVGCCLDWDWCAEQRMLSSKTLDGWDANGAPTGIDSNGDAL